MARLLSLLVAVVTTLVGVVAWIALDVPIGRIRVDGALGDAERNQVRAVVEASLADGILSTDLDGLARSIEALSWPRFVTVRRVWPNALAIHVEKAMVVARWSDDYLTSDGQVVTLAADRPGLPALECAVSEPRAALEIFHRFRTMGVELNLEIARLSENDLGEWELRFTSGATLMLGSERLAERFETFAAVYQHDLQSRFDEVAHMDARYASGLAVSWRPEALAAATKIAANGS